MLTAIAEAAVLFVFALIGLTACAVIEIVRCVRAVWQRLLRGLSTAMVLAVGLYVLWPIIDWCAQVWPYTTEWFFLGCWIP